MVLFERSIEEQKLDKKSYKTYIDDGDNKVYSVVVNSLPYGGGGGGRVQTCNKEECHAHITKNIGTGLRTLVKNYRGIYCSLAYRFSLRIIGLVSMWFHQKLVQQRELMARKK